MAMHYSKRRMDLSAEALLHCYHILCNTTKHPPASQIEPCQGTDDIYGNPKDLVSKRGPQSHPQQCQTHTSTSSEESISVYPCRRSGSTVKFSHGHCHIPVFYYSTCGLPTWVLSGSRQRNRVISYLNNCDGLADKVVLSQVGSSCLCWSVIAKTQYRQDERAAVVDGRRGVGGSGRRCEAWVCQEKHKSMVNAVGMRYLRYVYGKTHMNRVSNEWVLKECGLKENPIGLGGECSTSEQCHVNYDHQSVTCNLTVGVCECSLGYYSRGGIDCRREAEAIGESCGIDADCRFEGATCAGNYTCQLKSVASIYPSDKDELPCPSKKRTTATPRFLESILTTFLQHEMVVYVAMSREPSQVQAVKENSKGEGAFVYYVRTEFLNSPLVSDEQDDDAESPDSTVDGSVVKVGDSCTDNSSCSGLAYSNCFLGECACLPGYYALQGDTCYTELGGTCAKDSDCVRADDVICLDKICACAAGSVATKDNRRCKKMKMFNNTCSNLYPETCSSYGLTCGCLPDSDSKLKCICAQGYHYENEDQLCWVSKGLNASCTDNKDCKVGIGSAICVKSGEDDRMCACTPGTNVSADGQNCVSVTGLESACSTDDDCSHLGSYVSCYSGSCSCDSNYYKNPSTNTGEPLCLPGIDGKCSEYDCQLDNTSCSSFNVCSCDESFTSNEKKDRCLKVAVEEGDNCTEHTQCSVKLGSSQCVDGSCVCLEYYHYMNGSCWETR
uniref:EGF-like domain-containing protein n=2 Tax=Timema TaxID=61471 RepID=A0A7R9JZ55_TIMGE|nr:unnamed protein product [Timema genevievae]